MLVIVAWIYISLSLRVISWQKTFISLNFHQGHHLWSMTVRAAECYCVFEFWQSNSLEFLEVKYIFTAESLTHVNYIQYREKLFFFNEKRAASDTAHSDRECVQSGLFVSYSFRPITESNLSDATSCRPISVLRGRDLQSCLPRCHFPLL